MGMGMILAVQNNNILVVKPHTLMGVRAIVAVAVQGEAMTLH